MRGWGFNIKHGNTIGKRDFTFGGTDDERAADFQQMLDDPSIKAIMCARGGYGVVRIIDRLKFDKFVKAPKWIIGFSDITVIHAHLYRKYGIHSIHSKMCNSFPDDLFTSDDVMKGTIDSIRKILVGEKMEYTAPSNLNNKQGSGSGPIVGGNLKLIETLAGTPSDLNTTGKILLVEDTGEYMYNIDRMFWNLKRSNKLAGLKGLIIGGFKVKIDPGSDDFGRSIYDVVTEKVKNYNFPVCFDFPVGHIRNNYAIRHGAIHSFLVDSNGAELRSKT